MSNARIGDGTICVEDTAQATRDGRPVFEWTITLDDGHSWTAQDLHGPAGGREPSEREMVGTLCSFLGASIEAREYRERSGVGQDCSDSSEWLFPADLLTWACQHSDAIAMLGLEIEEGTPDA